jgi:hypothetical protein
MAPEAKALFVLGEARDNARIPGDTGPLPVYEFVLWFLRLERAV